MKQKIEMLGKDVRCVWDEEEDEWYYSIADVIQDVTKTDNLKHYVAMVKSNNAYFRHNWNMISVPKVVPDHDGVKRRIMTAKTQHVFRIIMELDSAYAEPFKLWICAIASNSL